MEGKEMHPLVEKVMRKRVGKGLSIRHVATITGVAWSTLARLERGEGAPDKNTVQRLERWVLADQGSLAAADARKAEEWMQTTGRRLDAIESRLAALEGQ